MDIASFSDWVKLYTKGGSVIYLNMDKLEAIHYDECEVRSDGGRIYVLSKESVKFLIKWIDGKQRRADNE